MAVLTREDYRARVNARVGENASDEDLAFLEDMTDTYDSLAGSEETIRQLREENDSLRRRYRERFEVADPPKEDDPPADMLVPDPEDDIEKIETVDDLMFPAEN